MLKLYFNSLGYYYVAVSGCDKVFDYVRNNESTKKTKYNVILLDTHLQKISGLNVANEIRKRNLHPCIMMRITTPKEQLLYGFIKTAKVDNADLYTYLLDF
jgi:DNA-binding response OmpR family regulator